MTQIFVRLACSTLLFVASAAFCEDRLFEPDAPLRMRIGGGNLVTHLHGAPSAQIYAALRGVGAPLGRMDSYGWRTLDRKPTPSDFDAAMREAYERGITPVILLEYEGSYQFLDPPQPIGSYRDWFIAGVAYARRFQPGGEWAKANHVSGWGATIFTAINEPDVQATIPRDDYRRALEGLADGVHSVNRDLKVVPGGFATCNSHGDATLRGYGPAIAPLLEDGRLDGVDLHTYYNFRWFPLTRGRQFSAQSCFDRVKKAMGLSRDINFYATEYNISKSEGWARPETAAKLFLTAFWDEMAVVGADGRRPATVFAMPWNLGDTGAIEGPSYAMAAGAAPWRPEARAVVLRNLIELAGSMHFISIDREKGLLTLEGPTGRLLVWHDLEGWTDAPGSGWTVPLPGWAVTAELWGWDGLRRRVPVAGSEHRFAGLKPDETYMVFIPRPKL
ncbi:hypothetical protein [Methylosinus sp. PW1]|uniref:hypothetical protein n=1 Tax=Methylosinus sp. PW1 TaxID=107636 RepID=UPI0009FF9716|nr:hypothetical protein [Methylosinus sp. PW1]